jgi:hypothetical protein
MKKEAIQKRGIHFLGKQAGEFLMDLANVPDWWVGHPPGAFTERAQFERHVQWTEQMRKRYPEALSYCTSPEVIGLRELLRRVWTASDLHKEWFVFLLRRFHSEVMSRVELLHKDAGKSLVREWLAKRAQLDVILMSTEEVEALRSKLRRHRRHAIVEMNPEQGLCAFLSAEQVAAAFKDGPPRPSYFENCAVYLQRRLKFVRTCNWPDCEVRPYYIADKPKQKYCSEICAREARLASKRKSWHKHPEWEKGKKRR